MNRFGGRFKYSKILQLIDRVDTAITSNITKVKIRRDMKALINQFAQYEICFGNRLNVKPNGLNIKSTGFRILGENAMVYLTDAPTVPNVSNATDASQIYLQRPQNLNLEKGILSLVKIGANGQRIVVAKEAGVVDYKKGEVILNTLNIIETERPNNIIAVSYTHLRAHET